MEGSRGQEGAKAEAWRRFRLKFPKRLRYLIEAQYRVRLGAFLALNDVELDVVAFFEAFVSVELDGRVVDEDIGTVFASDESIAFCVVKPFDLAFVSSHVPCPFLLPMAAGSQNSIRKWETQTGAKWFARSATNFIFFGRTVKLRRFSVFFVSGYGRKTGRRPGFCRRG